MSNVRALREHAPHGSPDTTENRLRMRGFWPLVEEIAAKHHVLASEFVAKVPHPTREIFAARCELFARIIATTNYSAKSLSRLFGVDHTCVLYALKKARCQSL